MSGIASKNLYELLGNDAEQDPDLRQPDPPTKAIDKSTARSGKRDAPAERPVRFSGGGRNQQRGDNHNANDSAFRDRGVGSDKNRSRGSGEPGSESGGRGGRGRGSGGRGGRGRGGGDRHSRTGVADHEKQVAHGWGGQDGGAEWADEKAGEAIAKQEEKEGIVPDSGDAADGDNAGAGDAAAETEEDKTKSYAAYLAEQAEKKLSLAAENIRKPNEGASKKFPEGKAIQREEEDFFAGAGGKAKRERERKQKEVVQLDDQRLVDRSQAGGRGGRGGGRGRGDRDRGEFRGRGGRGRGEGRGPGAPRGGRGGQSGPSPQLNDKSAFPALGA